MSFCEGTGLNDADGKPENEAAGIVPRRTRAPSLRPPHRSSAGSPLQPTHAEEAYVHWIRRYIEFHQHQHPRKLAEGDVNRFLTHLAVKEHVAASTQNQALSAILFLYEHVLEQPLDRIEGVVRARRPKRLPVLLTVDEVSRVLAHLNGDKWLIAMLLYGGGLRLPCCGVVSRPPHRRLGGSGDPPTTGLLINCLTRSRDDELCVRYYGKRSYRKKPPAC